MLDTSVIYPFLFAVVSVAAVGVAIALGLLVNESRANRRRLRRARGIEQTPVVTAQGVARDVNADRTTRS